MLIVLPPSEGKNSPSTGPSLDRVCLSFAGELSKPREQVLDKLVALASGSRKRAMTTLGLTVGLSDELARDANLMTAPCGSAIEIYAGVLYRALDWRTLSVPAQKRGESQLLVVSALFGALRPLDLIPAYRLSMNVNLPKIGGLGAYWKKHLPRALDDIEHELIIDMRSQAYVKAWTPDPARTAGVRVLTEKSGKRSIVSHMAKLTRGEITRSLLELSKSPKNISELAQALSNHFEAFEIEVVEPAASKDLYLLNVILRG